MSQSNLEQAQARYAEVLDSGQRAAEKYQDFVTGLRNQIRYFELDMSRDAVDKLEPAEKKTAAEASELFNSIEELTQVTRNYIKSMK